MEIVIGVDPHKATNVGEGRSSRKLVDRRTKAYLLRVLLAWHAA
jgi:hypothetical protein